MKTYNVTTTETIVNEMARYDNANVTRGEFVGMGIIQPITVERDAIDKCAQMGCDPRNQLRYVWRLQSKHVTTQRWQSFGVRVHGL